jgi:hypothetical protein
MTQFAARMRRIEQAVGARDEGYLFIWPNPPEIGPDGRSVPSRCHGAFYVGGARAGQDVTGLAELEAIYGERLKRSA